MKVEIPIELARHFVFHSLFELVLASNISGKNREAYKKRLMSLVMSLNKEQLKEQLNSFNLEHCSEFKTEPITVEQAH